MPVYSLKYTERIAGLAVLMTKYYTDAWDNGIREKLDELSRSGLGFFPAAIATAEAKFDDFRRESRDSFGTKLEAQLLPAFTAYFNNSADVASKALGVAKGAMVDLAKQIPIVGSAAGKVVQLATDWGQEQLRNSAQQEADSVLRARIAAERAHANLPKPDLKAIFSSEKAVREEFEKLMDRYVSIGKYIVSMNTLVTANSVEVAAYPTALWNLQREASGLRVAVWSMMEYLDAMNERAQAAQAIAVAARASMETDMKAAITKGLDKAYDDAILAGTMAAQIHALPLDIGAPTLAIAVGKGAATQLAAQLEHATELGFYHAAQNALRASSSASARPMASSLPFVIGD